MRASFSFRFVTFRLLLMPNVVLTYLFGVIGITWMLRFTLGFLRLCGVLVVR